MFFKIIRHASPDENIVGTAIQPDWNALHGWKPSPSGRGRRDSQRAGAPGEGCKSRQILNPHLYLRLRPIGLALRALSQRERVIHQNFNFALKRICLESVSSVAVF